MPHDVTTVEQAQFNRQQASHNQLAQASLKQCAAQALSALILALALSAFANASYIHAKATLAQWLIANAWQQVQQLPKEQRTRQLQAIKPWPWADTWPVARLQYPKGGQDLYILAGAQGNSLAFGPGHLFSSSLPGTTGVSVVGGHRDTHFAFLQHLDVGETLLVTSVYGDIERYTVSAMRIADSLTESLLAMPYSSQLLLVTCYPFQAVSNGSLRYVVTAQLQTSTDSIENNTNQEVLL